MGEMEGNSRLISMTTQPVIETNIVERAYYHWEIVNARYEDGAFHIEFKDGTQGKLAVAQFSALAHATEADFEDLQVSPCGLILENDSIEWDYAEAGLYQLIVESDANSDSEIDVKKSGGV